jgi:hypothetical protein
MGYSPHVNNLESENSANYSGTPRKTVRLSVDEAWAFVEHGRTGVFTTLRRDGVPISLPVWFVVHEREIYIRTFGKKVARVKRDPRAALLVEDGHRWAELKAVHMTGTAAVLELTPDLADWFNIEMACKYGGRLTAITEMPGPSQQFYRERKRVLIRFTPDRRYLSWDNSRMYE